jgi:lysozyme family protein
LSDAALSRRDFLIGATAAGITPFHGARGFPKASKATLPQNQIALRLSVLEAEATAKGLSARHLRKLPPLSTDNVYLVSLPRTVDLAERVAGRDPTLSDEVAILLNQINTQETAAATISLMNIGLISTKPSFDDLKLGYQEAFDSVSVRLQYVDEVNWYVTRLISYRQRYESVSALTNVPWYVIGVTHALEASFNFLGHLHNGDVPLDQQTRHVPAGRPDPWIPPFTWERSAEDALRFDLFADNADWSLPKTLYRLEGYNGFGYRTRNINSPYLWAMSTHYDRGKYIEDGVWSATAKSQQCGAAVMIDQLVKRKAIKL